jgi:hypothetical protein
MSERDVAIIHKRLALGEYMFVHTSAVCDDVDSAGLPEKAGVRGTTV